MGGGGRDPGPCHRRTQRHRQDNDCPTECRESLQAGLGDLTDSCSARPSRSARERPVLVDEWQKLPEVWDVVRRAVDANPKGGQFLLVGSATPAPHATAHTGAGRIGRLRMRPLTLSERGLTRPTVSLRDLLAGGRPLLTGDCELALSDYVAAIGSSGSGRPRAVGAPPAQRRRPGVPDGWRCGGRTRCWPGCVPTQPPRPPQPATRRSLTPPHLDSASRPAGRGSGWAGGGGRRGGGRAGAGGGGGGGAGGRGGTGITRRPGGWWGAEASWPAA